MDETYVLDQLKLHIELIGQIHEMIEKQYPPPRIFSINASAIDKTVVSEKVVVSMEKEEVFIEKVVVFMNREEVWSEKVVVFMDKEEVVTQSCKKPKNVKTVETSLQKSINRSVNLSIRKALKISHEVRKGDKTTRNVTKLPKTTNVPRKPKRSSIQILPFKEKEKTTSIIELLMTPLPIMMEKEDTYLQDSEKLASILKLTAEKISAPEEIWCMECCKIRHHWVILNSKKMDTFNDLYQYSLMYLEFSNYLLRLKDLSQ